MPVIAGDEETIAEPGAKCLPGKWDVNRMYKRVATG
jgi:hypothetical protein